MAKPQVKCPINCCTSEEFGENKEVIDGKPFKNILEKKGYAIIDGDMSAGSIGFHHLETPIQGESTEGVNVPAGSILKYKVVFIPAGQPLPTKSYGTSTEEFDKKFPNCKKTSKL
ncbi:MAG: hypothetical protein H7333_03435 [Bdellovibrionales bacterium]|nr:hypothetical protein [Oligoflexia bacterium]